MRRKEIWKKIDHLEHRLFDEDDPDITVVYEPATLIEVALAVVAVIGVVLMFVFGLAAYAVNAAWPL